MALYGKQISDLDYVDPQEVVNDSNPGVLAIDAPDGNNQMRTKKLTYYALCDLLANYGTLRDLISRSSVGPKGYYSFVDPEELDSTLKFGTYWWAAPSADAVLPKTGFPVQLQIWAQDISVNPPVGHWVPSIWYSPAMWDQWANMNDEAGWYWFGGDWHKYQNAVDGVTLDDVNGIFRIKDEGVTLAKLNTYLKNIVTNAALRTGDTMTGALHILTPADDDEPAMWGQVKNLMPAAPALNDYDILQPGRNFNIGDIVICTDSTHYAEVTQVSTGGQVESVVGTIQPVSTQGSGAVINAVPATYSVQIDAAGHYYRVGNVVPVYFMDVVSQTLSARVTSVVNDMGILTAVIDRTVTAPTGTGAGAVIHAYENYDSQIMNAGTLYWAGDKIPTDLPGVIAQVINVDGNGAVTDVIAMRGSPNNFHGSGCIVSAQVQDAAVTIIKGGIGYAVGDCVATDAAGLYVIVSMLDNYGQIANAEQTDQPRRFDGNGAKLTVVPTSYAYRIVKRGDNYVPNDIIPTNLTDINVQVITVVDFGGILGVAATTATAPTGSGIGQQIDFAKAYTGGNAKQWDRLKMMNVIGLNPKLRQIIKSIDQVAEDLALLTDEATSDWAHKIYGDGGLTWDPTVFVPAGTVMTIVPDTQIDATLITDNPKFSYTARPTADGHWFGFYKTEDNYLNFGHFGIMGDGSGGYTLTSYTRLVVWDVTGQIQIAAPMTVLDTQIDAASAWAQSASTVIEIPDAMLESIVEIRDSGTQDLIDVRNELLTLFGADSMPKLPLKYVEENFIVTAELERVEAEMKQYTLNEIASAVAGDVVGYFGFGRTVSTVPWPVPTSIIDGTVAIDFETNTQWKYVGTYPLGAWVEGDALDLQHNAEVKVGEMQDGNDQQGQPMYGMFATALWTMPDPAAGVPGFWSYLTTKSFTPDNDTIHMISGNTFAVNARQYALITENTDKWLGTSAIAFKDFWLGTLQKINGIIQWLTNVAPGEIVPRSKGGTGNANGIAAGIDGLHYAESTKSFQTIVNEIPVGGHKAFTFVSNPSGSVMPQASSKYACCVTKNTTYTFCIAVNIATGVTYVQDASAGVGIWLGGDYNSTVFDQAANHTLFNAQQQTTFWFIQQIRNNLKWILNYLDTTVDTFITTFNATTLPGLNTAISGLGTRLTTAEGNITTLQEAVTGTTGLLPRVNTLESNTALMATDITTLGSQYIALSNAVGERIPLGVPSTPGRYVLQVAAGGALSWVSA